jgi:hypothetical protein
MWNRGSEGVKAEVLRTSRRSMAQKEDDRDPRQMTWQGRHNFYEPPEKLVAIRRLDTTVASSFTLSG